MARIKVSAKYRIVIPHDIGESMDKSPGERPR